MIKSYTKKFLCKSGKPVEDILTINELLDKYNVN